MIYNADIETLLDCTQRLGNGLLNTNYLHD
jgi:hypothetical protein